MKGKELKAIVNQIGDDEEVKFEYSMFFFSKIRKLYSGDEIKKEYGAELEYEDDIPECDHMIEFDN